MDQKALVIIPVFNEEKRLGGVLGSIPQQCLDTKVDTLIINDGSTDASRKIAEKQGCLIVDHPQRLGYGVSVTRGFDYAIENDYSYLVKLDGDGQHDSSYVSTIVKILRRGGTDYVLSSRYLRIIDAKDHPPLDRRLVNIMITGLINKITRNNFSDVFCGCFGLTTQTLKKLNLRTREYGLELEMIIKAHSLGARLLEIPHPLIYNKGGSQSVQVLGENNNIAYRVGHYSRIIQNTLKELERIEL